MKHPREKSCARWRYCLSIPTPAKAGMKPPCLATPSGVKTTFQLPLQQSWNETGRWCLDTRIWLIFNSHSSQSWNETILGACGIRGILTFNSHSSKCWNETEHKLSQPWCSRLFNSHSSQSWNET